MSNRLSFLDSLRGISIIMIVAGHALYYAKDLSPAATENIRYLFLMGLPTFYFVDGFLLARGMLSDGCYDYLSTIKKSAFRLLIPWLVFSVLYALSRAYFESKGLGYKEKLIVGHPWPYIIQQVYSAACAQQMYFLLSLFLCRLCAPIVGTLFVRPRLLTSALLWSCYFGFIRWVMPLINPFTHLAERQNPVENAVWGMQFFLLGVVVYRLSETVDFRKLLVPGIGLILMSVFIKDRIFFQYGSLLTVFLLFMFFKNGFTALNFVGRSTMGIYLIHSPFALKAVSLITSRYITDPLPAYLVLVSATTALTVLFVSIINRLPYGPLLFGVPVRSAKSARTI